MNVHIVYQTEGWSYVSHFLWSTMVSEISGSSSPVMCAMLQIRNSTPDSPEDNNNWTILPGQLNKYSD